MTDGCLNGLVPETMVKVQFIVGARKPGLYRSKLQKSDKPV